MSVFLMENRSCERVNTRWGMVEGNIREKIGWRPYMPLARNPLFPTGQLSYPGKPSWTCIEWWIVDHVIVDISNGLIES
jgi:hypothetical protein